MTSTILEARHAIDHYHDRLHGELLSRMTARRAGVLHDAVKEIA